MTNEGTCFHSKRKNAITGVHYDQECPGENLTSGQPCLHVSHGKYTKLYLSGISFIIFIILMTNARGNRPLTNSKLNPIELMCLIKLSKHRENIILPFFHSPNIFGYLVFSKASMLLPIFSGPVSLCIERNGHPLSRY